MDIRRLLTGMVIAMGLVFLWGQLISHLSKEHPEWGWNQPATQPTTTAPSGSDSIATPMIPGTQPAMASTLPSSMPGGWMARAPQTAGPAIIGSATASDPAVKMAISLTSAGAGVRDVQLNEFQSTVDKPDRYIFQQPYHGETDNETRSLATRSIKIDGQVVDLLGDVWSPVSVTSTSATYRTEISNGVKPAVQIDKTYTIAPASTDGNTSEGYEVAIAYRVTNLGTTPINASLISNGPNVPPRELDRSDDRQIIGGYIDSGYSKLSHWTLSELSKTVPTKDFSVDADNRPMLWSGLCSVYFSAIVRPDLQQPIKFTSVSAKGMDWDETLGEEATMSLETPSFAVPAGGTAAGSSQVFFGPKKRELLNTAYYSSPLLRYDDTLVMTSGPCAYITSASIIDALYFLLSKFHFVLRDWGLSIIALVFLVRLCLHPITKRAQLNMAKMQKMGPAIEQLKKKHGDNKEALNKAMWEYQKEQGLTPILGCLPMFLQMPIWIALYSSLQSTFALRQAPFLGFGNLHLTWIKDLAHPDRLFYFPDHPIPLLLFHWQVDAINVLPILLGCMSWIQAKITRSQQPPATTPEQAQQQKMMQWMVLMLPIILYNGPSGLNLYILTSTTFGIIESRIVKRHIKEREAAEAAGVVIVDAPPGKDLPPVGGVRRKGGEPEKPKGGMMARIAERIADLQAKAEAVRIEQEKRKKR